MGLIVDITTRCNMLCDHCMWSRTLQGDDMTLETFKAVLAMEPLRGRGTLSMGTGEPTVHPQFWEFMDVALADGRWRVRVVTNGKRREICLKVAQMASRGEIEGHLSLDQWHDPIHPDVVEAFRRDPSNPADRRAYRHCRPEDLKNAGRCDFGPDKRPTCRCPVPKVRPHGDVYWCGCEGAVSVGNVNTGIDRGMLRDPSQLGCDSYLPDANREANARFFGRLRLAVIRGGDVR